MEPSVVKSDTVERSDIPLGYTRDAAGRELSFRDSYGYWEEYTRDEEGRVLTYRNSDGFWYECTRDEDGRVLTFRGDRTDGEWYHAVARVSIWTLFRNEAGLYLAGCRDPWTAERALQHWGERKDARAVLFTEAIRQQEGMRSS